MTKPLALVGYLGPNNVLTRATSLVSTELAAMAAMLEDQGYEVALGKTDEVPTRVKAPETGLKVWDNKTQPELVWLHQACVNLPGGVAPVHLKSADALAKALPNAKKILRLVVDTSHAMSHRQLLNTLKAKGKNSSYLDNFREKGPNESYIAIREAIIEAIENKSYYEVGYEEVNADDIQFKRCSLFLRQLEITAALFPKPEKEFDFCYIGASRSHPGKKQARMDSIGSELLSHENAFYGGSLFSTAIRFPKAWDAMSRSKGHIITRDKGMEQKPLHRYVQALVCDAIPVVVNEPDPVGFIHTPELQDRLRVKSYEEAKALVNDYDEIKPLLKKELEYWHNFDQANRVEL